MLVENILRIPNDIHHHIFMRGPRVDACPQLWSEDWTLMLGKTLKHTVFSDIGDNQS